MDGRRRKAVWAERLMCGRNETVFCDIQLGQLQRKHEQRLNRWRNRDKLLSVSRGSRSLSTRRTQGRKRTNLKALSGRGRRQSEWVTWIYPHILDEFDRLQKAGLKFGAPLLRQVAEQVLQKTGGPYSEWSRDEKGALLKDLITARWI